jgi:hypothetical protein
MSVLGFPRLYLRGRISWDPIVSNNGPPDYDAVNATVGFRPGETAGQFRQRHIEALRGDWNYFGTHRAAFESVVITGGERAAHRFEPDDPLVGAPVELEGKLVDLDPYGVHTSQIFFDQLVVGAGARPRLTGKPLARMSSRWLTFRRNLGRLPIAGGAGATFQAVFPRESLDLDHAGRSPLLDAFRDRLKERRARGLMLRMSVYATLYFRNGVENRLPPAASVAELKAHYQADRAVSNPAYGAVVGVIGLWRDDEVGAVPGGRLLIPSEGAVAPVAFEVDEPGKLLSLDLTAAVPELNVELDKQDFGALEVGWRSSAPEGQELRLADLPAEAYARPDYDARSGIIDLDLSAAQIRTVAHEPGALFLRSKAGASQPFDLEERVLTATPELANVYLDPGTSWRLPVVVQERGQRVARPLQLLVATYDLDGDLTGQRVIPVEEGRALVEGVAENPGLFTLAYFPFGGTPPEPPRGMDSGLISTGAFTAFRVLPADVELGAVPDAELTWDLVYRSVLMGYDAIAPRMSHVIRLDHGDAVATFARRFLEVTDPANFESGRYMPVTRDLSAGKRTLLRRFCQRALVGSPGANEAAAVPAPLPAAPRAAPPPSVKISDLAARRLATATGEDRGPEGG